MGTLDRYKKSGGFLQLLQLIETCGPQKQEKFLNMVKEEDAVWSEAIEKKIITMDKILSWSDEAISEIAGNLQDLTLAVAFHGFKPEARQRFFRSFSFAKRRKIEDLFEIQKPSPADVTSAYIKIFIEVRGLISQGILRADKIDSEVLVEDNIEEKLKKIEGIQVKSAPEKSQGEKSDVVKAEKAEEENETLAETSHIDSNMQEELKGLRKKFLLLKNENQSLKQDVHNLKAKIEQIKKIAA